MALDRKIVLASASTSRKRLLESVGLNPEIVISGVDEEDSKLNSLSPRDLVLTLAIMKAHTAKEKVKGDALIIGADSTFEKVLYSTYSKRCITIR